MTIGSFLSIYGPAIGIASSIIVYCYYRNAFKYWKRRGVAGPKPYLIVGNMMHLIMKRELVFKWMRDYGKVFGTYEGSKPTLSVADPAVLRQICIKDFDKFPNHTLLMSMNELQKNFLFGTQGEQWRKQRILLSPTFTSGKMRRMYKLLEVCADDLLDAFREQLNAREKKKEKNCKLASIVNLKDLFSLYTMDAIASCCYGLKLERYSGLCEGGLKKAATRDDFIKHAMKIFDFRLWRMLVGLSVDERLLKMFGFNFFPRSSLDGFATRIEVLIRNRRQSGRHFDDYLQTLLDAKLDDKIDEGKRSRQSIDGGGGDDGKEKEEEDENEAESLDSKESHHLGSSMDSDGNFLKIDNETRQKLQKEQKNSLDEIEILASAMFLLVVGLETTATLLTHCFYSLAFHEEIQDKLYKSVRAMANVDSSAGKCSFDYETLISNQYLDAVISETLRCLPVVSQTDRSAHEDYHLESHNLFLPKGSKVMFHLGSIMQDPDNWRAPETFDPERFMPGQREQIVPGSYCPFGVGPRHCLGMRFSLTEAKLALARLVMEFKFAPAPGLKFPPEKKINFGLGGIKRPEVHVVRR